MHRNPFVTLAAAATICAAACAAPASAQQAEAYVFTLPSQDLSTSLRAVSVQTGRSIVVSADLVRGRRAPALSGTLTVEEAVRRLIADSGLELRELDGSLVIAEAGGGESREAADAQAGPQAADKTIVVTGTHLRGAPASSAVIVIGRDDIDRSGATSIEQLMRKLPQNTQGGVNQENFGVSLPDQDVTDHGAGLNLRGLGQRATLVLVNGRRLAPSGYGAYVDVSLIPVSLIERVEILTDGASAIYGSDAVGGVVNFILRDRIAGLETLVQAGAATRGGGEQLLASLAAGADWNGGHGLLAYEYRREDEVRTDERDFTIGLQPDTYLLPREQRHSGLATIEQHITDGLTLGAMATYAHRSTDRTYFQSVSPLPIGATAEADALTLAGELTWKLGSDWRARAEGTLALSESDQRQTQPGGLELANARDVRNLIAGGTVKVDGPVLAMPGGDVRAALGAEFRRETYRDGFSSSSIPRIVNRDRRDVRSVFGELSIPLVSSANRRAGLERLELSLAGRFDDYTGTGSNFDPKVAAVWSPIAGLAFRGSYGTSFRAPLLSEIGGNYNVLYLPAPLVYQDPAQADPGDIVAFLQGSDPDVQPETSRTWTVGGEIAPPSIPGLSLSLNYYSVRFTDRIALPARIITVVGDPAFEPIIDSSPDVAELTAIVEGAQVIFDATGPGFTPGSAMPADVDLVLDDRVSNTARTLTSGLDFVARYAFDAGSNRLFVEANVNHVLAFKDRLTATSPLSVTLNRLYGPLAWRARGGLGWSRDGWAGSGFVNYSGAYDDDRSTALVPIRSFVTLDVSLSYDFGGTDATLLRGARVALVAENVLDESPPTVLPDAASTAGLGYDPVNASGRGRFVSLQLRKRW